jgi:cytochrome c-type biogenesis protein CcsB
MLLSYSIFAIAFLVGLIYVWKHVKLFGLTLKNPPVFETDALKISAEDEGKSGNPADVNPTYQSLTILDALNFKLISVGLVMLTAGIILGAVWADTAWGRPWGWDPKETWAAISWGVYALFAHLHLFGKWRGITAVLVSILGFLCVIFTYVGVSFFLAGLHSYA